MGSHLHKCGYGGGVFVPNTGCGHVWSHDDSMSDASKEVFNAGHICPRCGRGLWTLRYEAVDDSIMKLFAELLLEVAMEEIEKEVHVTHGERMILRLLGAHGADGATARQLAASRIDSVSPFSVHVLIGRLARKKLVRVRAHIRDTGGRGRARNIYELTEAGKEVLKS